MVSSGKGETSSGKKKHRLGMVKSKSFMLRCCKRRIKPEKKKKNIIVRHDDEETGYNVDISDLLFTPERDFLITNNGRKIMVDDLKGKTIVLFIVPIYEFYLRPDNLDMAQAYHELAPFGDVEFVFVPVYIDHFTASEQTTIKLENPLFESKEALFNHLFETMPPWPTVPFSDIEACGDRVVETFSVDNPKMYWLTIPYWVIIDHDSTVVATRAVCPELFKAFGGAELHPLSSQRILGMWEDGFCFSNESRKRIISKWDQILVSPGRDFLLSSTGQQVPVSSLKGKVIGLYFCENTRHVTHMDKIHEAYQEAKRRGYDFEIVQINFHYHFFDSTLTLNEDLSAPQQRDVNTTWLTLPFKDPSCRKLQRMLDCGNIINCGTVDFLREAWKGSALIILDTRLPDRIFFEFSGVEIIVRYGADGYPFTRQSLVETEYKRQKRELNLKSLFPLGKSWFHKAGEGDLINVSQLSGKRVLVFFATKSKCKGSEFLSMLKSKYTEQADDDENMFEVVYVSTDHDKARFSSRAVKRMPWLVHDYDKYFGMYCPHNTFKTGSGGLSAAAFDRNGDLVAKEIMLNSTWGKMEYHKLEFPFISEDLKGRIPADSEEEYIIIN